MSLSLCRGDAVENRPLLRPERRNRLRSLWWRLLLPRLSSAPRLAAPGLTAGPVGILSGSSTLSRKLICLSFRLTIGRVVSKFRASQHRPQSSSLVCRRTGLPAHKGFGAKSSLIERIYQLRKVLPERML